MEIRPTCAPTDAYVATQGLVRSQGDRYALPHQSEALTTASTRSESNSLAVSGRTSATVSRYRTQSQTRPSPSSTNGKTLKSWSTSSARAQIPTPPRVFEGGPYYGHTMVDTDRQKTVLAFGDYSTEGTSVRSRYLGQAPSSGVQSETRPHRHARTPAASVLRLAENGSYYGQISESTGRSKTVFVRGYYRKDGTYVRAHYRSRPRS
jgi:hypothetical protein